MFYLFTTYVLGGYSKDYVPFCGIKVCEKLSGYASLVEDTSLEEIEARGYQDCQLHQAAVVDTVASLISLSNDNNDITNSNLKINEIGVFKQINNLLQGIQDPIRRNIVANEVYKNN